MPGVQLTLVAEHPDVVTPTGIDVDASGNIWFVCSHTHFRPEDYQGPEHDEVVVIDADGNRRVFYQQTHATMDLELGADGWVYLAERDRILRVRDSDGDGRGDEEQVLVRLETEADYPHNGLSGLAWHPDGDLIFALGENYSRGWTMKGPGPEEHFGTGEGGVFRCHDDGTEIRRIAKGFWNPFGLCVRSDGTMFAAENDPGARPPCRLLHIVDGGQYGYQRAYGNAPFHPFVCWNGQLRGTLPMLHSLGEAPCGIAPLAGGLIVPSWTDHRIDFYPLTAKGASFETRRVVLVEGGRQFRPTCVVQSSPTTFYLTDWVYGSYKLHGYGRIWKLEIDANADWLGPDTLQPPTAEAEFAASLRAGAGGERDDSLLRWTHSDDPFVARAALDALAQRLPRFSPRRANEMPTSDRISLLLAIRLADPKNVAWTRHFWNDLDPEIRFETLRWIADERLLDFQDDVQRMLQDRATDYRLFEAALATANTLAGTPELGVADPKMLIARIADRETPPLARSFALRLIDPSHGRLNDKLCDSLEQTGDASVLRELTRTLVARGTDDAQKRLLRIASDDSVASATRADAIAGLTGGTPKSRQALLDWAASPDRAIREESLRSLRAVQLTPEEVAGLETRSAKYPQSADLLSAAIDPNSFRDGRPDPSDTAAWRQRLAEISVGTDVAAGRRIFHHGKVALCSNCHRHDGRGKVVGPDLTAASNVGDEDRLLKALLQPSRDVDPQYYPWSLVTIDGQAFTGILLRDGGGGTEFFRDSQGRERRFMTTDIVARKPLTTSMMPGGLIDLMTDREIRDLLAFLDASQARQAIPDRPEE